MGAVSFSIDPKLVTALQASVAFEAFVETGTFRGDTLDALQTSFPILYSIESSSLLYEQAEFRFRGSAHIHVLLGNSPNLLAEITTQGVGRTPTLYWLDAHWCEAEGTAGALSQCPLLEEIEAIGPLHQSSVVLIDDARLFIAAPPPPHEISQWPAFTEILEALRRISATHRLSIINDVIAFYPAHLRDVMEEYARQHGLDWLTAARVFLRERDLHEQLVRKEEVIQAQHAALHALQSQLVKKEEFLQAQYRELAKALRVVPLGVV